MTTWHLRLLWLFYPVEKNNIRNFYLVVWEHYKFFTLYCHVTQRWFVLFSHKKEKKKDKEREKERGRERREDRDRSRDERERSSSKKSKDKERDRDRGRDRDRDRKSDSEKGDVKVPISHRSAMEKPVSSYILYHFCWDTQIILLRKQRQHS